MGDGIELGVEMVKSRIIYLFREMTNTANVVPFSLTTFYLHHNKWSRKHNSALANKRFD
jgi:hypothetical protein